MAPTLISMLAIWYCIGYYDVEHQEYADLGPFAKFIAHPEVYLGKIMEGEL